jgi:ribosomal protein S18 acetylase RimI-like enzyme
MEEKHVTLKDGSEVVIRPMRQDDLERSIAFFAALPREDRAFLRVDVTKRHLVEERMFDIETGSVKRIVAILGDEIIADGALELAGHGWKEHAAELRLIVARNHQRKGLGMLMARELYAEANAEHVEEIVVKMMRPQNAAHSIFKRLGFRNQMVLPEYVKDREGKLQDMILGRCNLKVLWNELEDYFAEFDYPRKR